MTITDLNNKISNRTASATIIPRNEHIISRSNIGKNALKVLYRLRNTGHHACLVGGSVRDLILERKPKDFDIATDAHPEKVRKLFRNCRLIGRRFRLAHVYFGPEIIEVSTFRGPHHITEEHNGRTVKGRIVRDNVYGSMEEDVWRRDFTVNALFYNIEDFSIIDYVGGIVDLKQRQLKLIGIPEQRYIEDPIRLLRVIRFSSKLDFTIHPDTEAPIYTLGRLLKDIPPARLFDEILKLFMGGAALQTFETLRHYQLFQYLFPSTNEILDQGEDLPLAFLRQALRDTDQRIAEGKPVMPGFFIAVLLWEPLQRYWKKHAADGADEQDAFQLVIDQVLSRQLAHVSIPRRYTHMAREIWTLQQRLQDHAEKHHGRILARCRFRAAYDFLLLRHQAGETLDKAVERWHDLQQTAATHKAPDEQEKRPQRRRPRYKRNAKEY